MVSPVQYAPGKWHHFVGTYDGATMRLYVNGVEVAAAAQTGLLASTGDGAGNYVVIGKDYDQVQNPTARWYDGKIDGVRLYTRALTAGEVKAHAGL